jgi:hypothetical protein
MFPKVRKNQTQTPKVSEVGSSGSLLILRSKMVMVMVMVDGKSLVCGIVNCDCEL